jgi:sugar phosphate permease
MLASFKIAGNVGFVMYIADAFGYMATVLVLIVNDYFKLTLNWVNFFINAFYICGVLGIILLLISWLGFSKHINNLVMPKK